MRTAPPARLHDAFPGVDIVLPVFNEERVLNDGVRKLIEFLDDRSPFTWRVTIADSASQDSTLTIAQTLAATDDRLRVVHLDGKGRGLALRSAWMSSDASVVAYMDVDWLDDADSRVHVTQTARDDLRGMARVARRFAAGDGDLEFAATEPRRLDDDMGRRYVAFAAVGLVSTALSFVIYLALRGLSDPIAAVAVALVSTSAVNSWAHRRWTLGRRVTVHARGGGQGSELIALGATWAVAGILRFLVLSHWTAPGTAEART